MKSDNLYVHGDQNVRVPAHLNFGKFIFDRLLSHGDKIALEHGETRDTMSYKELVQYAVNIASILKNLGVKGGDVVAVGSEPRVEIIPANFAIIFTGAIYTDYDLDSGTAILTHKLSLIKPSYMICSKQFWEKYREIIKSFDCIKQCLTLDDNVESLMPVGLNVLNDVDINKFEPAEVQGQTDTAVILYSSGTTGMSKGVQLTHLNCILHSLPDQFNDEVLQTAFAFAKWYHNYDAFMTYKFLSMGRKVAYVTYVTPQTVFKCIEDCKVNVAFLIPSFIIQMLKEKEAITYKLDSLKIIYSRAMSLHRKTIEQVKWRFPNVKHIHQGYGMTESGELTSESWGTNGTKHGSVGMASPGITIKVVDLETRKTLGPNERGEICIKGPVLMKGYINMDPSTYLDEQGFLKTGDLGYYDEDNYFYIVGRLKDIIVYAGCNVCPMELEALLILHPGVREAGVIGKPVPIFGEEPTAFVVKQPGVDVTEQELVEYVSTQVSDSMQLRGGVKFIEEIPKNPRGKIIRKRLQEILHEML